MQLIYMPNAHTDGDIIVHFPEKNYFHLGDISFGSKYNVIDLAYGGTINGLINALKKIIGMSDKNTIFTPGHGGILTREDLEASLKMFTAIRNDIQKLKKQGLSLEKILSLRPTKNYDNTASGVVITGDRFTELVYKSLN